MDKKYELTNETREVNGVVLHRIRALRDFGHIKAGELGGFVEKEENLSRYGNCWVSDDACVFNDAIIYDNARVHGHAKVSNNAEIYDNARVHGHAKVSNNAEIYGHATINDNAEISGNAMVYNNAAIYDNAKIYDNVEIYGSARVYDDAIICCSTKISSGAAIAKGGIIGSDFEYIVIGPIGSRCDYTTFYRTANGISVCCGCYHGTLDEFEKRVNTVYNDSDSYFGKEYNNAIYYAKYMMRDRHTDKYNNVISRAREIMKVVENSTSQSELEE